MSPDAQAATTLLAVLRAELKSDVDGMDRQARELQELLGRWEDVSADRPWLTVCAVALHAWYTALETGLERVARALDRHVPAGPRSQLELVQQLAVEVPGVRPAVLAPEVLADLRELLKFRHFFRHAYNAELSPGLIEIEARRLVRVEPGVRAGLRALDTFLVASLAQIGRA
jgi:hypothetical protein